MAEPLLDSDLTLCDLEPITRLERVQSFGFLLALTSDWVVARASANLETYLGIKATDALGRKLDALFDGEALHDVRNRMTGLSSTGGTERIYGVTLIAGRPRVDVAVHYSGSQCILEGEPAGLDNGRDAASMVRKMLARLSRQPTLHEFHADAARQIRAMTGFDRVMIYQFTAGGAGEVIADATAPGTESFLGLHYPASDIPVQARALYLRNPFRIIADVHATTVPLLAAAEDTGPPLDLTLAITRAISPVHLEYLRNMGVGASLSISIIVDGILWGLIACHHGVGRLPTFVVRTAAELFGKMYSMTLESRLRQLGDREDGRRKSAANGMLASIKANNASLTDAGWMQNQLQAMIPCDGVSVVLNGRSSTSGETPAAADIAAIAQRAALLPEGAVFATDSLAALNLRADAGAESTAGVLCIPLSSTPGDYLMAFRRERRHEVRWAGRPEKVELTVGQLPRLSPRKSFASYTESVRGRSLQFDAGELRIAEMLCAAFTDGVLRGSPHFEGERRHTLDRQELLIAELNHRVRNVLALIRGLISQTNGEGGDTASYVRSLSGRVQALARAHDRASRQNWGPSPLHALFDDEIAAYAPTRRERFTIRGADVLLQPPAFSALSLVIHELVTNSSKYGSLSDSGRVEVTLDHRFGEGLIFKWCEKDGPPVQIPTRRGFGSVIVERLIPFDLQGTSAVQYLPAGLEAEFFIPERHLVPREAVQHGEIREGAAAGRQVQEVSPLPIRPLQGLAVLLLEDNLIVALEAEDVLKALGAAAVHTASTITTASVLLESEEPRFAVLDINLGFETSLDFGLRLRHANIPFIFASGYGDDVHVGGVHPGVLTVSKPYDQEHLGLAIARTLAEHLNHPACDGSLTSGGEVYHPDP